jgi:hypothetical protein
LVNGQPADVVSAALGTAANAKFVAADVGKPVKLGAAQNYVLCSAGDQIEGFVQALDAFTVNDGFSFGAVLRNTRITAKVDAAQASTLTIGEYVVAGASSALGTNDPYPLVKQVADAALADGAATVLGPYGLLHKWRVIRVISGTGIAGDLVLLEKV